jgi:hypothetical protein
LSAAICRPITAWVLGSLPDVAVGASLCSTIVLSSVGRIPAPVAH